jgi:DNA polymerase-4
MQAFAEPFLHVDMDAFFVEVERLHDPSLTGRPVVVGGTGPRSVVAAASYEARRFGVQSAMPMGEARRRCPQALVVPPHHDRYAEVSDQVFDVLRSFTPLVEGLSVDEAFLDVSGLRLHYDTPAAVGEAIRRRVRGDLGLPCSVGGATTKFLAKLASEDAKPDGLLVVPAGQELAFLHPLPVRRLWGVGEATLGALEALGATTIGDLARLDPSVVSGRLGRAVGTHLHELANGRDPRPVVTDVETKSVSAESTYAADLTDLDEVEAALLRHCDHLAARLRHHGWSGRTVTLKLRFGDFTTLTRSLTPRLPVHRTPELWDVARELLGRIDLAGRGVRLLGVAASGLVPSQDPHQLEMERPNRRAAADAAEEVRARFGDDAVRPARLVDG